MITKDTKGIKEQRLVISVRQSHSAQQAQYGTPSHSWFLSSSGNHAGGKMVLQILSV